jgi:16S rRNA (guanine527-N7)-methyltransferase
MDTSVYDILKKSLEKMSFHFEDDLIIKLVNYWNLVWKRNLSINLISRKTDYVTGIITHIVDSLTVLKLGFSDYLNYMDFGSGGGFPGFVLKLVKPEWNTFLVESSVKKSDFLNQAIDFFGLKSITVQNVYFAPGCKSCPGLHNRFDLVTARAVAKIHLLVNLIGATLKDGGFFVCYKGPNYMEELDQAQHILMRRNLELIDIYTFNISIIDAKRSLLLFKKV